MKLKGILKALAPTLVDVATSSNPIAGMAVKMAAKKLGMPDTSSLEQIEETVERDTDKASLLLQTENELKAMEINLEGFKVETEDRQDARSHFSTDPFPKIFALICLIGFLGYIFMISIQPPEQNDLALVNLLIGNFFGLISGISAFYFGSSHNGNK